MTALLRRSVTGLLRQPGAWLPGLLFPLVIAAVFTADYHRAARLLHFPGGVSYVEYVLPATALIGAIYAGITAGTELTTDLAGGFLHRLLLSPSSRAALLAGPLVAAAVQTVAQDAVFLAVFAAFGVPVHGVPALIGASVLFAAGVGGFAVALGLRTGDAEVIQSLFGLLFIMLFVSSAFFPPSLMRGWFGTAARYSPLTWLADGMRGSAADAAGPLAGMAAVCAAAVLCAVAVLRSGERS
jgi:ABC-2 type transport system permease protein